MRGAILYISLVISTTISSQSDWKIELLNEEKINTPHHEFSPTSLDEQLIFVSSYEVPKNMDKRNQGSYFDLKISAVNLSGSMIGSAFLPEEINSDYHEGPATYDQENRILYFTRSEQEGNQLVRNTKGQVLLQIYYCERIGAGWTLPAKWEISKSEANYCHPAVSVDGKTMVFASDKESEDGKMDLFVTRKSDEGWSQPESLDSTINSAQNECFPYLHAEGYLFFSSNGITSRQGYDLFVVKIDEEYYSEPKILPVPLNSNFDDFGIQLSEDEKTGFISSNRSGGKGFDDIYSFSSNASILDKLFNEESTSIDVPIGLDQSQEEENDNTDEEDISINTEIGSVTVFNNIYYELNSYIIIPEAAQELEALAKLMKSKEGLKVQLSAHTDARGSESYNQELSDKRAIAARNFLINAGVQGFRISAVGFGESRLRNRCGNGVMCSEEEHRRNRRTEVKILDN